MTWWMAVGVAVGVLAVLAFCGLWWFMPLLDEMDRATEDEEGG